MANRKNRTNSGKTESKSKKLVEIERILKLADEQSIPQFDFVEYKNEIGFENVAVQNPETSFKLYYKMLERLKREYIPKGKVGEPLRYQIKMYLKEGHEVGRDGRQARTHRLAEAVNIFTSWINELKGANIMNLFYRFYDKNLQNGFVNKY